MSADGNPDEMLFVFVYLPSIRSKGGSSTWENAVSEDLRKLHEMVERVKHDEEVAIRYMRLWEEEESIRRKALEEGIEKGIALERGNTEKEKARADDLARKNAELLKKLEQLEGTAFLCKS
jgi:hypothetical protein